MRQTKQSTNYSKDISFQQDYFLTNFFSNEMATETYYFNKLSIKLHCLCMRVGVIFLPLQRYLDRTVKIDTVQHSRTQWTLNNEHSWHIRDDALLLVAQIALFCHFYFEVEVKGIIKRYDIFFYYRFTIRNNKMTKNQNDKQQQQPEK